MKIRLFTIPNMLTLSNLLCGSLAVITTLRTGDYKFAFMLVILAAVFDFFDGFVARLLKQCSPLGLQLDSLADMVSFGLAPSLIMMTLFERSEKLCSAPLWCEWGHFIPLIIVALSALRLAKFNIDETQCSEFVGLPTPACALFCVSIGLLYAEGFALSGELIAGISVLLALLLISPIKMFALKFKGAGWKGNEIRYCFVLVATALVVVFKLHSLPLIVALYIVLSTILHLLCKRSCAS